jgi:hypothetical protein
MSLNAEHLSLLLDTNVFLHYRSLEEIDWLAVTDKRHVTLVVAPIVVRELNKHKDNPRSKKLRDRASSALRKLRNWKQLTSEIRPGVALYFIASDPQTDFAKYGLVRDIADDWLVATALQRIAENPSESLAMATADLGLEIKASPYLPCVEIPEEFKLPDEETAEERQIRDLERAVRDLQNAIPSVTLIFADGSESVELNCYEEIIPTDFDMEVLLSKDVEEHPKLPAIQSNPVSMADARIGFASLNKTYNEELEEYFKQRRSFYTKLEKFGRWYANTAEISFSAINNGGVPAEDLDINLHFPDGFEVLEEKKLLEMPEEPDLPQTPEEKMRSRFDLPSLYYPTSAQADYRIPSLAPRNVQLQSVKKTKSHDVAVHIRRLKHQSSEKLPTHTISAF